MHRPRPARSRRARRLRLAVAAVGGVAALLLATAAPGVAAPRCDRYASPAGADRGAGTAADPFRSAQRLAGSLRAGQTGCLRKGTYRARRGEEYVLEFERAGRRKKPIRLRSHPGERARVVGIIWVQRGSNHVRISKLDIVGTGVQNTVKTYAAHTVVEDSDITNRLRGDSCMILGSSSGGRAFRPIVRRNVFHDCGSTANDNHDHSIYAARVARARIVKNTFSNSAGYSIQLYPDSQRSYVARNVIDGGPDTVRGGIVVGGDSRSVSSRNLIERNVIAYVATSSVATSWDARVGSRNLVRDNCVWGGGDGFEREGLRLRGNVTADPGFRDRARRDYRLGAASRCRPVLGR